MNSMDSVLLGKQMASKLKRDFDRQPCGKKNRVKLESLDFRTAEFSKPISLGDCAIDSDGTAVVQGGEVAIVANFAGVYLARLTLGSDGITPLRNLNLHYFRPFILGKDERIVARSFIDKITDNGVYVVVLVENEKGRSKGQGSLSYAKKFHKA